MTAREAKQKADELNDVIQYEQIIVFIKNAVTKGKYEVSVPYDTLKTVREKLESDGFKVGQSKFDRNQHYTIISWKE